MSIIINLGKKIIIVNNIIMAVAGGYAETPTQDILNYPTSWPVSFPKPTTGTRVLTYIFNKQNESKVEKLLNLLKTKYPGAKVAAVKDSNGFTSVSITQLPSTNYEPSISASADTCFWNGC
jgi:hypothetical protein